MMQHTMQWTTSGAGKLFILYKTLPWVIILNIDFTKKNIDLTYISYFRPEFSLEIILIVVMNAQSRAVL